MALPAGRAELTDRCRGTDGEGLGWLPAGAPCPEQVLAQGGPQGRQAQPDDVERDPSQEDQRRHLRPGGAGPQAGQAHGQGQTSGQEDQVDEPGTQGPSQANPPFPEGSASTFLGLVSGIGASRPA